MFVEGNESDQLVLCNLNQELLTSPLILDERLLGRCQKAQMLGWAFRLSNRPLESGPLRHQNTAIATLPSTNLCRPCQKHI